MHLEWFEQRKPEYTRTVSHAMVPGRHRRRLLSIVGPERLARVLHTALDEAEFLSPHGLRSLSQRHRDEPFVLQLDGGEYRVGYEPGESQTGLFGGNSNWRGPVWLPLNVLVLEALLQYDHYVGDDFTVELPTGSGRQATLREVVREIAQRLVSLFQPDADGAVLFHEYFHGDTGQGLGADHQTGWTATIVNVILALHAEP
jgi:glycogen debranching enzyme